MSFDRDGAYDVAIIGAGPAGLTAAFLLSKQGARVIVVEKDPVYVGGISKTVKYKGFHFDIGGHRFFSKSREVLDLWAEILPDDFLSRPRLSRIFYNRKFYSYPLRAFEALSNLGAWESLRCVLSYCRWRITPIKNPRTFREWVSNQFGARLFNIFFKTYTEKVWGMSCDEISADWAAQRIKGLSLWGAIYNGLQRSIFGSPKQSGGPVVKTLIESFQYPRRGPGMMWEAAAKQSVERGCEISMGTALRSLEFDDQQKVWSLQVGGAAGERSIRAREVISSAPLRELAATLEPPLAARSAAQQLRYRDFVTVALMMRADNLFNDNWIYVHDDTVKVGRIQNFGSWSPEMVPNGDYACLGLEYFCFEHDGLWDMPDQELIKLAAAELKQLGLVKDGQIFDGCVVRQEKAYPIYDDSYQEHVTEIRAEIERKYPTLHLVGRNGMHKYNNQDHAMMTAMLTVENINAGYRKFDIWCVNEDAEYHEEGKTSYNSALSSERSVPARAST